MIQINLLAKELLCRNLCTIVIGYQSGHKAERNKSVINSSACAFDTVRLCNYSNADTPYNRSVDVRDAVIYVLADFLTENQCEKKKFFFLSGKGGYPPP